MSSKSFVLFLEQGRHSEYCIVMTNQFKERSISLTQRDELSQVHAIRTPKVSQFLT